MPLDYFGYQNQEQITYWPGGLEANAVTLNALVYRQQQVSFEQQLLCPVDICIPRGSGAGQIANVDITRDRVLTRVDPYGSVETCRVLRLLNSDANLWTIRAFK